MKKKEISKKTQKRISEDDDSDGESVASSCLQMKFPRTRHLLDLGGVSRDDLLMDKREVDAFLASAREHGGLIVEEKIDGANLGISMDPETYQLRYQNRSHFVTSESATQWKGLKQWETMHAGVLVDLLGAGDKILFGEWMALKHSIHYTALPAPFIAFDIFDLKAGRFVSAARRDAMLEGTGIPVVPNVQRGGEITREKLIEIVQTRKSSFYDGPAEGVYLRVDSEEYNEARCKIVRSNFLQSDDHWTKAAPVKNIIIYS